MTQQVVAAKVDREQLRDQIRAKYVEVAVEPEKGFHFHTGHPLAAMLGYDPAEVDWLPASAVESFAGTGNPFSMGRLGEGETALDIGCGPGQIVLKLAQRWPGWHFTGVDRSANMVRQALAARDQAAQRAAGVGRGDNCREVADADAAFEDMPCNGRADQCGGDIVEE